MNLVHKAPLPCASAQWSLRSVERRSIACLLRTGTGVLRVLTGTTRLPHGQDAVLSKRQLMLCSCLSCGGVVTSQ